MYRKCVSYSANCKSFIFSCSQCFPYQTGFERHFWQSGVWWALGKKIGTIVFLSVRVIQIKWVKDFESRRALLPQGEVAL